jgi:hypothetical protein
MDLGPAEEIIEIPEPQRVPDQPPVAVPSEPEKVPA